MNEIPRRIRIDQMTPAELAIRAAVLEVEKVGADVRLTDAVVLLGRAQEKVADFVDGAPEIGLPDGEYAIVELLGHRTLVGRIAEIERFGTKLLQVEPIYCGKLLEPVFHHGSALYGLTPCTKETAQERGPRHSYQLPGAIRARIEPPQLPAPAHELDDYDAR